MLKRREMGLKLKNIKKLGGLFITFLFLFMNPMVLSATSTLSQSTNEPQSEQNKSKANNAEQAKEFYLIIQSSPKADIEKNEVSKPGTFKLRLHDVTPAASPSPTFSRSPSPIPPPECVAPKRNADDAELKTFKSRPQP